MRTSEKYPYFLSKQVGTTPTVPVMLLFREVGLVAVNFTYCYTKFTFCYTKEEAQKFQHRSMLSAQYNKRRKPGKTSPRREMQEIALVRGFTD